MKYTFIVFVVSKVPSLYEVLSPDAPQNLVCVELSNTDGPGFIHGRDSYHRLIIKHVAENQPLQKSDRYVYILNFIPESFKY